MMDVTKYVCSDGAIDIGSRLANPRDRTDPANERISAIGVEELFFEPFLLRRAHHRFLGAFFHAWFIALRTEVGENEFGPANGEGVGNRTFAIEQERIMRHILLVTAPSGFVG